MLTLIVPGLIWTRQALADLTGDLPLPAFSALLGRGWLSRLPPLGSAAALAACSGLALPLPAAALRRLALGQGNAGDSGDWLCVDPVRLNFHERSLIVDDPRNLRLEREEAEALAVALAPTLAALGQLEVISPGQWNLRLAAAAPPFPDLPDAAGRAAVPLPGGAAHAPWRQALNEAQMVLHAHPVNRAREAAGKPPVNSLWPWGGGRLPATSAGRHDAIWSDDPVAQGIARLLQIEGGVLPANFAGIGGRAPLAVIAALEHPARSGDAIVWRDELAHFDAAWLAPILAALRAGRLDALRLIAPGELAAAELRISRRDMWKFWRKPRTLAELVAP